MTDDTEISFEHRRVSMKTAQWAGNPVSGNPGEGQLEVMDDIIYNVDSGGLYPFGGICVCVATRAPFTGYGVVVVPFDQVYDDGACEKRAQEKAAVALMALEEHEKAFTALLEGFLSSAASIMNAPVSTYSITVGNGEIAALVSWKEEL